MSRYPIIALFPAALFLSCLNGAAPGPIETNPVAITATADAIRQFCGGRGAKIAFVNVSGRQRTLCFVDATRDQQTLAEFSDETDVFMPTLSPDGRFVAYCTNNEGQSGLSQVWIRPLESGSSPAAVDANPAYIPRWWVHPSMGDTFIVYTNSAAYNEHAAWDSTKTFRQLVRGGQPAGTPELLAGDGSFHDGLSRDGNFLVTGFSRLLVKNLASGAVRQLFTYPENGKDSLGSNQVCNVSISPDTGSGVRCLFLDFGSKGTSALTGTSYGIHQYLFVTLLNGSVTGFINCPEGEKAWEYTEWSNHPDYAVACLRNDAGAAHAIVMVNLTDGTHCRVASGTELQHPALWLE